MGMMRKAIGIAAGTCGLGLVFKLRGMHRRL
jgi:hypothetical protein